MDKTFYDYYLEYLDYLKIKLKPQSVRSVESRFRSYILPYFKNKKISDITPTVYLEWQKKINKNDFKYTYKKTLHYAVATFYEYLNIFHNIRGNVPKMVGNFKDVDIPNEMNYWTYNEYIKFENSFDKEDFIYKAYFIFLFHTGCREGEALALQFIDIKNDSVFISKTLSKEYFDGSKIITRPKTKKSIRHLRIDNYTKQIICELRKLYRSKFGNSFNDNFYVFGGTKPLSVTSIERRKNKYVEQTGIKNIRIHDIRHSHATFLIKNDVPIIEVSRRLGHSDINTTINTYTHLQNEYEKKALDAFNSLYKT